MWQSAIGKWAALTGAALGLVAAPLTLSPTAVSACNVWQLKPVPADRNAGATPSHFQGGLENVTSPRVAGSTITYFTPSLYQPDGTDSGSWQMLVSTDWAEGLIQIGFINSVGDTSDNVFYEYGDGLTLYNPVELRNSSAYPHVTSRFNVVDQPGSGGVPLYSVQQGSTVVFSIQKYWQANQIEMFGETHDEWSQGYGGTSAKQTFTYPQWEDQGGHFYTDSLSLTPNNVTSRNDAGAAWWPWLKMDVGPNEGFSTYDRDCSV